MGGANDGRYSLRRPSGAVCEEVVAVPKFDARPESLKQTAPPPTEATAPAPTARPGARKAPPAEPRNEAENEAEASEGLDVDDALELPALDVDEALELQQPRERRVHSEERLVVPGFDARQPERPAPPAVPAPTVRHRAKKLIEQLRSVGPEDEGPAVAAFRSLGVEALPFVAEAFPGLCWFDRRLPFKSLARGRDTGPLARVLAGFGAEASATVAELMRRPETDKRFYATLLGVDVGGDAVLEALAERILDSDLQTFDAAVVSLERWRDERGPIEAVLAPMREALPLAHVDRGPRLRYVTALHRLRDPRALEAFARALDPFDAEMAERAHLALRTLTGHDLGKRPEDWAKWVKKQAGKPRGRWLADALVGDDPMLVQTAVHELAGLGFDASAALEGSPRDRKKVRKAALRELA
ncbi:MAG: hypothetical protein VYE22_13340 [Myxococcota bacterium]|nr:hypothetical protein [Myxococcota bacterium]